MGNHRLLLFLLVVIVILVVLTPSASAFGAGNVPSHSHVEGVAFRHGDLTDALVDLYKKVGGGLLGLSKGTKFSGLDVKRVYFGNWLRDYSQAVDIAALKKTDRMTILNLIMALGFMAHGYATAEFEVTEERLGTYLPVEHIDNPKGYGEGEDPRKYHPKLRPPVDPRELEIDHRTGMKNYIANEQGGWDTSTAHVRRVLLACIEHGRRSRSGGPNAEKDEYEAYRLLGTAMHTLEDFPAHSNWCEIALVKLGFRNVFCHVGDNVRVRAPSGESVPPIVTGSFGGVDFFASLMGEATDHLSSASVTDLTKQLDSSRAASTQTGSRGLGGSSSSPADILRDLLFQLEGMSGGSSGGGNSLSRDMDDINAMRAGAPGARNPETMSPQELHATLWKVLAFRDRVMKTIENTIDRIPGLSALVDKISNSIAVFVFTTLDPFLKPIIKGAQQSVGMGSQEVLDRQDQLEVFNNPNASDPTHSMLSKDHFDLVLNNPAGNVARIILIHSVKIIVDAWGDSSNPHHAIDSILECIHHPYFASGHSQIQNEMMQFMQKWVQAQGHNINTVIGKLDKESCRCLANKVHGQQHVVNDPSIEGQQGADSKWSTGGLQSMIGAGTISKVPGLGGVQSGLEKIQGGMSSLGLGGPGGGGGGGGYRREAEPTHPTLQQPPHGGFAGQERYSGQPAAFPAPSPPVAAPYGGSHGGLPAPAMPGFPSPAVPGAYGHEHGHGHGQKKHGGRRDSDSDDSSDDDGDYDKRRRKQEKKERKRREKEERESLKYSGGATATPGFPKPGRYQPQGGYEAYNAQPPPPPGQYAAQYQPQPGGDWSGVQNYGTYGAPPPPGPPPPQGGYYNQPLYGGPPPPQQQGGYYAPPPGPTGGPGFINPGGGGYPGAQQQGGNEGYPGGRRW